MNWSSKQFGLMVAYVLPGFIVLAGLAPFSLIVSSWLQPLHQAEASLGAPLYAVLVATTIGMILSCFRWLIIDHIHFWTGLKPPVWDDSRLEERIGGFDYLVNNHFMFHEFYAHSLIAVLIVYCVNRIAGTLPLLGVGSDVAILILCGVLFVASRDALSKYYARTIRLIGQISQKGESPMTNGNHPHHNVGPVTPARPRPEVKLPTKPQTQPAPKRAAQKNPQS